MEKPRKSNWSKEEEYTLIDAIQSAGDLLRGTGHFADLNRKKLLWNDMVGKVNSIHGNNRDVRDLRKNGIISRVLQSLMWTVVVEKQDRQEEDHLQLEK